jgi:hypothetical protein
VSPFPLVQGLRVARVARWQLADKEKREEVDDMFVGGKTLISQIVLRGSFLQQFAFIIKEFKSE